MRVPRAAGRPALLLVMSTLAVARAAMAQEPPPTPGEPVALTASPAPSEVLAPRPVTDSIEPAVAKAEAERADPCKGVAVQGVPCFAASAEKAERVYSVRDSFMNLGKEDLKAGGPPPAPFGPPREGAGSSVVAPVITFDPGCVAKALVKKAKGKNDVFYLYRLREVGGDRIEMRDSRLDASTVQGHAEFLGRYEGECDAVAAYRAAMRQRDADAAAAAPAPTALPSAAPTDR